MGPWFSELWRILVIGAGVFLLGLATGRFLLFGLLGVLCYLALHLYQVRKLERWLRAGKGAEPPDAWGIWGEAYHHLYGRERRSQERVRRLRALLNRFQDSAAALPDGIVALARDNTIEWINDAAMELLGLRAPKDIGQAITNFLRTPLFSTYMEQGSYEGAVEISSPVNEGIRLQVRVVPYGKDERLLIARDVTHLHKLEQVRRDFVANVSHELRTPLTVIAGYLEAMADAENADGWADSLQAMTQQTLRMQRIVEDLLLLTRLEAREGTVPESTPVAVPALIEAVIAEARQLSAGKHRFDSRVDPDLWIGGRESELHSAFSNLVSNAVRYTPAGGVITVSWLREESGPRFRVADTGPGIALYHIDRLTERFYRVDAARSRELGGTGLGLAIVKHVLNRHGANLAIESEPGKGSRFSCEFPTALIVPKTLPLEAGLSQPSPRGV